MLISATAMGGRLGFDGETPTLAAAGHGAVLGFLKCLGLEWQQTLVRAVDLDPRAEISDLASAVIDEMSDPDGPLEVGVQGAERVTWKPISGELDDSAPASDALLDGDVVLLTGGARGITAVVAERLAKAASIHLVLVGRSPLPATEEAAETAPLTDAAAIKKALIERRKASGASTAPADIEAEYQRLLADREIRGALQRLGELAASVRYYSADVRDEDAMRSVVAEVERDLGAITGVIHGAGVIEDKLLADKTPESFHRVFSTKVYSAAILTRVLSPQSLKFLIFFSSIASRYGNRGQSDYAAANEVQSKLAWILDRQWPGRVAAICWGPWSGVGMVSDLEKHLAARGVTLISQEEGPEFVLHELLHGAKGQSEILVAGGANNLVQPQTSRKAADQPELATAGVQ